MEANIVTEHAIVRQRPEGSAASVGELRHGDRVILGEATFRRAWVEVTLPDGRTGHIRGEVRARSEPMSHAIVLHAPMPIRASRDMDLEPNVIAAKDQIIATGADSPAQYISWSEVQLPDGTIGYVPGEPVAQRIVWSQLTQKSAIIRSAPNLSGSAICTVPEGAIIGIGPAANLAQHPWLRALLPDGTDGFVPPDTQIVRLDASLRLRRLLSFPGKCAACDRTANVTMCNLHLHSPITNRYLGDCFVPICSRCVRQRMAVNLIALFLFGTGTILTSALTGHELVGAIGYVPFGFYSMNVAQKGGTVRRYRRAAMRKLRRLFEQQQVDIADLNSKQETDLDEQWPTLSKWIICPGCLSLHKEQAPWCPQCRYIFPWRFGPRP